MISDRLTPPELRQALETAVRGVAENQLRTAATRITDTYREETVDPRRPAWSSLDCLAYAATRMPATYQAAVAVYQELQAQCPGVTVTRLLDIGAGPATALWAARTVFADLMAATLVEPDPAMVALGSQLIEGTSLEQLETTWQGVAIDRLDLSPGAHDVVVASYVLAELEPEQRRRLVDVAWEGAQRAVVLIEPGSVRGYRHILDARDHLIGLGARLVAPCPHEQPCPLPPDDWCHFAVRLNRSAMQRRLKAGRLAYEDEKYAYLVATRESGTRAPGRIIRRPTPGPGRVSLHLCGPDGVTEETVSKSRGAVYRAARRARWGDAWPSCC